ncbi:MAG: NUDIX domain-containing protein [Propionibacteriaceae bacterium]|nr:NUDIX domain-containing protein [Propionibacteriaceae bacterium]
MPGAPSSRPVKRRRGARVLVIAPAGDGLAGALVLLQGDTDPGLPGSRFWQTPGGGIDPGETPRQAAARELYEETGLAVDPAALDGPIATRTVTHGYSDRVLIQHETYFRLVVERFEPVPMALSPSERRRRVETAWHSLDNLPPNVWPDGLAGLAHHDGEPLELGDVEESTVPA